MEGIGCEKFSGQRIAKKAHVNKWSEISFFNFSVCVCYLRFKEKKYFCAHFPRILCFMTQLNKKIRDASENMNEFRNENHIINTFEKNYKY